LRGLSPEIDWLLALSENRVSAERRAVVARLEVEDR
jgi:hypothetical protein